MRLMCIAAVRLAAALAMAAAAGPARAGSDEAAGPADVAAPGDVAASFAAPCKYPAGMATDGTHLYVVDWRAAEIHQVAVADGAPVRVLPAPTLKPHGLAWGDGRLYVSDDRSGWVYTLDPQSGIVERAFEAPGPRPVGLAHMGGVLYVLEGRDARIYKVLPDDGTILASFDAPTRTSACLAADGKYLWAADRIKDELYMIDPERGLVLNILAAPGPYPAGLACLAGDLWNVDFQTRRICRLTLRAGQKYRLSDTRTARVEYHWALYNYGPGEVRDLVVHVALPPALPNQALLSEIAFAEPPAELATDQWGQRCAVFRVAALPAGTRQLLGYRVAARVSAIRYLILPEQTGTLEDIPADIRAAWTADAARYRIDTPFIRDTVRQVVGTERNPYWIARRIFNHVIAKLEYEMAGGWDVPEVVLQRGKGSCSEYTFALIALCRAAGLPARYVGSIVVRGDDASVDEAFHRWAEVYLPNYGWIPVDANKGDAATPADQARGFGELTNRFLITTHGGGGSTALAWSYNSHATYTTTGYCKLEEEHLGFWEPLPAGEQPGPPAAPGAAEE